MIIVLSPPVSHDPESPVSQLSLLRMHKLFRTNNNISFFQDMGSEKLKYFTQDVFVI